MNLNLGIDEMIKVLEKREREQDEVLRGTRELIRHCSKAIKAIHAKELKLAMDEISGAEKLMKKLQKAEQFKYMLMQSYQEFVEMKVLLAIISKKEVPAYKELGVPFESYLLGLCDCIGELRREMLESLKRGKKKDAQYYFDAMSAIYEQMIPLRFSNSLLPNFRKKQDVARMQVEQARSELLRFLG